MMNANILVTGGAGYIGSHACKALKSAGFIQICIDNLSTGWEDAVQFGPFEHADLLDKENPKNCFVNMSHKQLCISRPVA